MWFERLIFVQRAYRKMKKSREVKKNLLTDLLETFLDEQRTKINNVIKLNSKLEKTKKKADKALIQKQIDS